MANTPFTFGNYKCIAFTSSEIWTVPADVKKVDVLVVAGGGGGSRGGAGGDEFIVTKTANYGTGGNLDDIYK